MDIAQMHFHQGHAHSADRVPERNTGMGIAARVEYDAIVVVTSLLNPIDQRSLMIGLKKFNGHPQFEGIRL